MGTRLAIVPRKGRDLQVGDWVEYSANTGPGQAGHAQPVLRIEAATSELLLLTVRGFCLPLAIGLDQDVFIELDRDNPTERLRI